MSTGVPSLHRMEFLHLMAVNNIPDSDDRLAVLLPFHRNGNSGFKLSVTGDGIIVLIRGLFGKNSGSCAFGCNRAIHWLCRHIYKDSSFKLAVCFFLRGKFQTDDEYRFFAKSVWHGIHIGVGRHLCALDRIDKPGDIFIIFAFCFREARILTDAF